MNTLRSRTGRGITGFLRPSSNTFSTAVPSRKVLTSASPYIRPFGDPNDATLAGKKEDFLYFPDFFEEAEQEILLKLALWKLDRVDSSRRRRRRTSKATTEGSAGSPDRSIGLQRLFEDTSAYGFEDGHFDSVITKYRESLLTAFPNPSTINAPSYPSILKRIYDMLPRSAGSELARDLYYDKVLPSQTPNTNDTSDRPFEQPLQTSTHALHLSPEGHILPHVDNVDASGTVIIGVSLGAERILRLEEATQDGSKTNITHRGWDVLLKSGSLYLQKLRFDIIAHPPRIDLHRDSIRYNYAHSILPYGPESQWNGSSLTPGHRVSLMIRLMQDAEQDPEKNLMQIIPQ
ncbi:hypothetical protein QFC21_001951 [Naganishia friedmannii]|uniref:Uncharacterized protein n=1 Tax=Naganishia friedmannii TaxID=89922 RepID=A0ACC2W0R9_9TREE|nr:hypothetical protein QFC21_001951 [Naganishia friedmannii]